MNSQQLAVSSWQSAVGSLEFGVWSLCQRHPFGRVGSLELGVSGHKDLKRQPLINNY